MNLIPARYAKFITSLAGVFILYIEMYGATWHFVPAMLSIAASLGVMGVPNAPKPVPDLPTAVAALRRAVTASSPSFPPSNVTPRPPVPPAA